MQFFTWLELACVTNLASVIYALCFWKNLLLLQILKSEMHRTFLQRSYQAVMMPRHARM